MAYTTSTTRVNVSLRHRFQVAPQLKDYRSGSKAIVIAKCEAQWLVELDNRGEGKI